jgi:hypothetical protein
MARAIGVGFTEYPRIWGIEGGHVRMSGAGQHRSTGKARVTDARGRRVSQFDTVAMHILHRHDVIPKNDLRTLATAIDPVEVKRRPRMALLTPVWITLWYAAFFGYFYFFKRWRGWDPVLVMFASFYFLYPIAMLCFGALRARRARWTRIGRIVIEHRHCAHCGYDLRGCPTDPTDGVTVCPECGCAWRLPAQQPDQSCPT